MPAATRWILFLLTLLTCVSACTGERYTELMKASRDGNQAAVKRALEAGAEVDYRTKKGKTALMLAAANGHLETIKLLLDHGAQLDSEDNFGTTAIIIAATAGKTETAHFLAEQGADPTHKDSSGGSALSNATFFGHTDTVAALLKYASKLPQNDAEELMMVSSGLGHIEVVKILLKHGISANARGIKQRTAIMAAAAFNKVAVTKLLLSQGADATLKDEDGYNAFDIASENENDEILEILSAHYSDNNLDKKSNRAEKKTN